MTFPGKLQQLLAQSSLAPRGTGQGLLPALSKRAWIACRCSYGPVIADMMKHSLVHTCVQGSSQESML